MIKVGNTRFIVRNNSIVTDALYSGVDIFNELDRIAAEVAENGFMVIIPHGKRGPCSCLVRSLHISTSSTVDIRSRPLFRVVMCVFGDDNGITESFDKSKVLNIYDADRMVDLFSTVGNYKLIVGGAGRTQYTVTYKITLKYDQIQRQFRTKFNIKHMIHTRMEVATKF
jgi:hypothetical protein